MLRFKHRRAGMSLMEALVALFIMAIGMISLLTLFPLGAIQMGRALRDDRCAQCAWQGDGIIRTWWQVEVVDRPGTETGPYFASLENGATTGPSNVVAIDPIGSLLSTGTFKTKLCGTSSITRTNSTQTTTFKLARRNCSLIDDVFFNEGGTPDASGGSAISRQGRYQWMAMIQRPVNSVRTTANLKILVFDGRPYVDQATGGVEKIVTGVSGSANSTQLSIPIGLTNPAFPPLGKGGWILDPGSGDRMDFYRVQSLTDNGTSTTLELDTPLKNTITSVIVLGGLAEVFDRPMLAPNAGLNPPVP